MAMQEWTSSYNAHILLSKVHEFEAVSLEQNPFWCETSGLIYYFL